MKSLTFHEIIEILYHVILKKDIKWIIIDSNFLDVDVLFETGRWDPQFDVIINAGCG